MKIKINESHVKIYGYLKKLAKVTPWSTCPEDKCEYKPIKIGYQDIKLATKLSYPQVAKCMVDLMEHGCIKKLQDGKGHRDGGSEYLVDGSYFAERKRVIKEKVYRMKYRVYILDLKKSI